MESQSGDAISQVETCIGICTFDRPETLRLTLEGLSSQDSIQTAKVLVLDNGTQSAAEVVAAFESTMDVYYESVTGIGLCPVRNRAIELAAAYGSRYLIFIDDDESPEPGWLKALTARAEEASAGLVAGHVVGIYSDSCPDWIKEWGAFDTANDGYGAGNLLLRLSELPKEPESWFRTEFSEIGGEDTDLVRRLKAAGVLAVSAPDAVVTHRIPASRTTLTYLLRLQLRQAVYDVQALLLRQDPDIGTHLEIIQMVSAKIYYAVGNAILVVRDFLCFRSPRLSLFLLLRDLVVAAGYGLRYAGVQFRFYGRNASKGLFR